MRKRSSIVIDDDLLIDLGPDSVGACRQYGVDLSGIRYILQTHAHSDHFDAGHLIARHPDYAARHIRPVTLVASPGTFRAMDGMLKREDPAADLFSTPFQQALACSLRPIAHAETIDIGGYSITALDSLHDADQQAMVFLITRGGRTVLYGTDLLDMREKGYAVLRGRTIDALILDQTYGEGRNAGGHLDAGGVRTIIGRLREMGAVGDATRAYATHISHEGNGTHRQMRALARAHGYDVAYDGLIVTV